MWSPDVFNITRSSALFQFSLSVLAFLGFAGVVYITLPDRPAVPRSYPYSGLVKELGGVEENAVSRSFPNYSSVSLMFFYVGSGRIFGGGSRLIDCIHFFRRMF
jgi:hypothetical protein